jgi:hypothetical protein
MTVIVAVEILIVMLLSFLFAYLYGFIEHGYIPPAEHLRLRFFKHFANYHIIMFGLFSALPLVVLVFQPNLIGILVSFSLWAYLPLGEDVAWYHFSGTWPAPEDWTSWGGGYRLAGRWVPRWYFINSILAVLFFALALALAILR